MVCCGAGVSPAPRKACIPPESNIKLFTDWMPAEECGVVVSSGFCRRLRRGLACRRRGERGRLRNNDPREHVSQSAANKAAGYHGQRHPDQPHNRRINVQILRDASAHACHLLVGGGKRQLLVRSPRPLPAAARRTKIRRVCDFSAAMHTKHNVTSRRRPFEGSPPFRTADLRCVIVTPPIKLNPSLANLP